MAFFLRTLDDLGIANAMGEKELLWLLEIFARERLVAPEALHSEVIDVSKTFCVANFRSRSFAVAGSVVSAGSELVVRASTLRAYAEAMVYHLPVHDFREAFDVSSLCL